MYVCICNAVTDRTIRQAAASGQSFAELSRATGCSDCCGNCTELAHEIFEEARGAGVLDLTVMPIAA
ncbi:(2Fe-2S)-binding protein [Dokdonella sp.]|uniref:(2Fe-2S)-binding protein n=1 Tax=Dokdonella sp. TaxID=2291710 RepID=UPI0031C87608|nr:(2Fe-2S)-binding protein [Dokdonella sp.]